MLDEKNQIKNISNTYLTSDRGSFTRLYGSTLRCETLVPSGGYITNNVNNTNKTSTNINRRNISSTGIHYNITSNISQLNVSDVSCLNLSPTSVSCKNLSTINDSMSFLNVSLYLVQLYQL